MPRARLGPATAGSGTRRRTARRSEAGSRRCRGPRACRAGAPSRGAWRGAPARAPVLAPHRGRRRPAPPVPRRGRPRAPDRRKSARGSRPARKSSRRSSSPTGVMSSRNRKLPDSSAREWSTARSPPAPPARHSLTGASRARRATPGSVADSASCARAQLRLVELAGPLVHEGLLELQREHASDPADSGRAPTRRGCGPRSATFSRASSGPAARRLSRRVGHEPLDQRTEQVVGRRCRCRR